MPTHDLNFCAFHYLNQWLEKDRRYVEVFQSGTREQKLATLKEAATFYRVARTLRTRQKTKRIEARYGVFLNLLDKASPGDFRPSLADGIMAFQDEAQRHYKKKYSIRSLISKMLWLKLKRPAILFDDNARVALGLPLNIDLNKYFEKWNVKYEAHKNRVKTACDRLPAQFPYVNTPAPLAEETPRRLTEKQIAYVTKNCWFRERVFDNYLWHAGGEKQKID